ncbi:MAG: DEAD/DEAH box helicase [Desulfurococcales archaeon]|nr:DEAD/DEAH box helicase [Desulfurococcales archaeon]
MVSVEEIPLPKDVLKGLIDRGIESLTPPQEEAVRAGLLKGRNIVVSAPTASGKTLIAELALIRAWLEGKKGIYAVPLKSLAAEKAEEFRFWSKLGMKVGLTTGDYDEPGEWLGKYDVVVSTYERLDSILRLKPSWLPEVSVIVIDEFHMIRDSERGPIIELLTVKALRMGVQVIGLSATIGNPDELAEWIGASLVVSEWRPVKLIEGYYSSKRRSILFQDGREETVRGKLTHHVVKAALEGGYQVLIFVHARNKAESTARAIARGLTSTTLSGREVAKELLGSEAPKVEKESLKDLLSKGVAFHHAGLSLQSRKIVEDAFRSGLIKAIVATPTLAAGINLPARRVVIYTKRYEGGYMRPISVAEYKQMAGRAGRPQYDPYGEAVIADAPSAEYAMKFIEGEPEDVESALMNERALRTHILALIASRDVKTRPELKHFLRRTLAYRQLGPQTGDRASEYIIGRLIDMDMITVLGDLLKPTKLGIYVSRLYIDPLTAVMFVEGLANEGRQKPLYYLVLAAMTPDFSRVRVVKYREFEEEASIDVEDGRIPPPLTGVGYYEWLRAYKVGRVLHAWIQEVPEDRIIEEFKVGAGDLRNFVETAEWIIYSGSKVCEAKGLREHVTELSKLTLRVKHGVKEELLDLVRVKGIGRVRARVLYSKGIRSAHELASSSPSDIAPLPTFGPSLAVTVIEEAKKLVAKKPDK